MARPSTSPVSPAAKEQDQKPQFSEDTLELARRIYDENRYYVEIAPSMTNQVYRYGLLPKKKTIDGSGYICMRGSKKYYRDSRSNTPDGSLIIHRDDEDPYPGACSAFIHPPYGFVTEYRSEKGQPYSAEITMAELADGSVSCGFCSILYRGIVSKRKFWIVNWARYRWADLNPNKNGVAQENESPWIGEYLDEIQKDKPIDESSVLLNIQFPKSHGYVKVHMMVGPEPDSKNGRRRPLIDFEFYTEIGLSNPWAAFGPAPHIHPEVFSESSISQMTKWIQECVFEHSSCNNNSSRVLPSRLLRLQWTQPSEFVTEVVKKKWLKRLIEKIKNVNKPGRIKRLRRQTISTVTAKDPIEELPLIQLHCTRASSSYKYIALSHVWNMTNPFRTTMANISDHMKSVPWGALSFALRDAIFMTLSLGVEYLWIDSLCIIQDSPRDWGLEAPRMGQIYGNAYVVFAAHGPELGLEKAPLQALNVDDPARIEDNPVFVREKIDHAALFSTPKGPDSWFGRGWCLQERVFAPRILHFGGYCEELFFECNVHVTCECGRIEEGSRRSSDPNDAHKKTTLKAQLATSLINLTRDNDAPAISNSARNDLWRTYVTAVEDYTARSLTFATDTFPAISSLMGTFSPHLGPYFAGLWDHNLVLSLQWEALDTGNSIRHLSAEGKYVAPSWSWASRSGAVVWYMETDTVPNEETHEFAKVVKVHCALADKDPFGIVTDGYITLRGRTTRMCIDSTRMIEPDGRLQMSRLDMQASGDESKNNEEKEMGNAGSENTQDGSGNLETEPPGVSSEKQRFDKSIGKMDERTGHCFATLDAMQDVLAVQPGTQVLCLDVMRDRASSHGLFVSGLVLLPVMEYDGDSSNLDIHGCGGGNGRETTGERAGIEASRGTLYRRIGFSTMKAAHFADQNEEEEVTII